MPLDLNTTAFHHQKEIPEKFTCKGADLSPELVWTGPSSKLIATRKTEQALLQVIDSARSRLFITSFVAYNIASIMKALERAIDRGVQVSMLLEASEVHGGGVSIDAIAKMKSVGVIRKPPVRRVNLTVTTAKKARTM